MNGTENWSCPDVLYGITLKRLGVADLPQGLSFYEPFPPVFDFRKMGWETSCPPPQPNGRSVLSGILRNWSDHRFFPCSRAAGARNLRLLHPSTTNWGQSLKVTLKWMEKAEIKCKSVPVTGPVVARRVGRGITLPFHDHCTRRGWVVSCTPWPYFTLGKTRYPLYRRLSGLQSRSGRAENLAAPGFDPRTVQP